MNASVAVVPSLLLLLLLHHQHQHNHTDTPLLHADVTSVCNPHGEFFARVFGFVRALPLGLWLALSGLTWITGEWYFFVLSHTYLLSIFVGHPILGTLVPWTASGPAHPECDSREYVGPALETLLLYQYLAQALVHNKLLWQLTVKWTAWLWKAALAVGVPWLLHYSGNYSAVQLVQGALIGAALGVAYMYVLVCWLRPHFWRLNVSRFCTTWLGMEAARDIADVYYRQDAIQQQQQRRRPRQRHFTMASVDTAAASAFSSSSSSSSYSAISPNDHAEPPRSLHGVTHSRVMRQLFLF